MSNSPQKTTSTSTPYAPATSNLNDILSQASTIGSNPAMFNPLTAESPVQSSAISGLGALAAAPNTAANAISPVLTGTAANYGTGAGQLASVAGGSQVGSNNAAVTAAMKAADDLTTSGVEGAYSNAGRYGSGSMATGLARGLQTVNAPIALGQANTEQANQNAAATTLAGEGQNVGTLATQQQSAQSAPLLNAATAGATQSGINLGAQMAPATAASYEAGLTQPIANSGGTSSGTSVQQSNPVSTALGAGLMGLSLFSDERTKENIREVGKTHDGQKIYTYNYKGDPRPSMGMLAHQVKRKRPEAVSEGPAGMEMVNYREATRGAARGGVRKPSSMGMLAG